MVADGSLVLAAAVFGRDNDNPVGCAGTVDGAGRSILQDVDGFDVGGVDVVNVAQLQAVNDEEWRVVAVGADPANEDGLAGSGLTTRFIHNETRRLPFQGWK